MGSAGAGGGSSDGGGHSGLVMVWMKSEKAGFGWDGKLAGAVEEEANKVANTLLLVLALLELQLLLLLPLLFKPVVALATGGSTSSEIGVGFSGNP